MLKLAIVIAVALTVSACSGADGGTGALAETKSPTQLLRNTAAAFYSDIAEADPEVIDRSDACHSPDDDPKGLVRRWYSSVDLVMLPTVTATIDEVPELLLDPLQADGWVVAYEAAREIGLTSQKLDSSIQITPQAGPDGTMAAGHVLIVALGPCVETDGADSDEVTKLESFSAD